MRTSRANLIPYASFARAKKPGGGGSLLIWDKKVDHEIYDPAVKK
jgi:hypothetical protein